MERRLDRAREEIDPEIGADGNIPMHAASRRSALHDQVQAEEEIRGMIH